MDLSVGLEDQAEVVKMAVQKNTEANDVKMVGQESDTQATRESV